MKKQILYLVLAVFCLTACEDFLSNVPKGQKIPVTLEDFSTMLADEYNNCRMDVSQAVILLNDRYVTASNLNYYELWKANYFWDQSADRIALNRSDETTYYNCYTGISTANLILENVEKATEATPEERRVVAAQARILRASKYFTLVNYYAVTYNAATAASDGGVPVITSAMVGAEYTQPSVAEVYDFILEDIAAALTDLPEASLNVLYADRASGYALAARVHLQMGQYQQALDNAVQALSRNDALFDWVAFYNANISVLGNPDLYQTITSPMGHSFVENYMFCHGSSSYATSESQVRVDRGSRFEEGDAAFMSRWKIRTVAGDTYYNSNLRGFYNYGGLTTTEVYLIQAECLARLGNVPEAMQVLNKVREMRILPDFYRELTASSAEEAVRLIRDVKADALIMTIIPFCDVRRMNQESAYAVTLSKTEGGQSYTLSPTSHMWTMPFPQGATANPGNGSLAQNVER